MQKEIDLIVCPEEAAKEPLLKALISDKTGIPASDIHHLSIVKRSIDARQRNVRINLRVKISTDEPFEPDSPTLPAYSDVSSKEEILIIGAGPAGLFAALRVMELGMKPVILERGKCVKDRIKDIRAINVDHLVNEDSNYCFGEGGAGTYSDGKLYTRAKKRGNVRRILNLLIGFGATHDILVDAQPHIGTNKLPDIISRMRECILSSGGELFFNSRVSDIIIENKSVRGVRLQNGDTFTANRIILASGHSARDIFEILHRQKVALELKPLAIGVRVEHDQKLIDRIQYSCEDRGPYLPPSSYRFARQINGRGVYSFCMCPGGVIAPCATRQNEIVTNGWSSSRRTRSTANSGIVVELRESDFRAYSQHGPLAAMAFQQAIEQRAWEMSGQTQSAPAQRMVDFVENKPSSILPKTSYAPGIVSTNLKDLLPDIIYRPLAAGFKELGQFMRGYYTNDAILHAPETRTSSPVRIPRNPDTLEHIQIKGLYPCGEGAGYAGGIVSAALDGERVAEKAAG